MSKSRTSHNSWCQEPSCFEDPLVSPVIERIANVTKTEVKNSEYLQMLQYEPSELTKFSKMEISLKDTALGRHCSTMQRQLFASVATMSPQDRENLRVEIENCKDEEDENCKDEEDEAAHVELQVPGDDDGNEPTDEAAI